MARASLKRVLKASPVKNSARRPTACRRELRSLRAQCSFLQSASAVMFSLRSALTHRERERERGAKPLNNSWQQLTSHMRAEAPSERTLQDQIPLQYYSLNLYITDCSSVQAISRRYITIHTFAVSMLICFICKDALNWLINWTWKN